MTALIRVSWGLVLALTVLALDGRVLAHPLSTFGVRLNVTDSVVTVILNADAGPLVAKLEALSFRPPNPAVTEPLERIRQHVRDIASRSVVLADSRQVVLTPTAIRTNEDGQVEVALTGILPPSARSITWQSRLIYGTYPLSTSHDGNGVESLFWLHASEVSPSLPVRVPSLVVATFTNYVTLGFVHIVPRGLDHILFVLGLFLLTPRIRPLLAQVTVFTIAHSVSLALAMCGMLTLSPSIVEPLIALSIAYVGIENLFHRTVSRHRLWMIGAFGLLHGLGFAGVLSSVSLPPGQWLPALSGFNVGVELGQLAVLAMAGLTTFLWTRWVAEVDRWCRRPLSAGIALMGVFWLVTRL